MRFLLPLLLLLAVERADTPHAHAKPAGSLAVAEAWLVADSPRVAEHVVPRLSEPEVRGLRSALERVVASPGWRGDSWSVLAVSLDRADTLFARDPHNALAPASNVKLFTSAAALHYLGGGFRYATYLLADGRIRDGTLEGDLILYGTGDPTLSNRFLASPTAVWESFADSLVALGVRVITGAVVGDGSYFGGTEVGEGWRATYMNASYAAPSSALSFNENLVTLHIRPAAEPGWRPTVQLLPGGQGIAIVNHAITVPRGNTRIVVDRVAYDGPITIRGQIVAGSRAIWRQVPVADPPRYAAATLREVLEGRGITVAGGIRAVDRADDSPITQRTIFAPALDERAPLNVVAIHRSPPLREILAVVNQRSHNLYADQVLRTIGRVVGGNGRMTASAATLETFLAHEVGAGTVRIFDGSGLSPLNRSSAGDLVALLGFMDRSPERDEFVATLPAAGGERLRRMGGTPAAANLQAKTGTIDRVSSLSGYVRAGNGELIAFAIISNDVPSTWRAKRVEDAVGERLASFRRAAPTLAGEPAPVQAGAAEAAVAGAAQADEFASATAPSPEGPSVPATSSAADTDRPSVARVHVIRSGDTLDGIARGYGLTVSDLRAANPGVQPRRLIPGRELRLP